jgi:hypothetical protein
VQRYVDAEDGLIVRLRPSKAPEDLGYQARLTEIVARCEPVYRALPNGAYELLDTIQAELGVPIGLTSSGPTFAEKTRLLPWPSALD